MREERVIADRVLARQIGRQLDELETQPTLDQITHIAEEVLEDDGQLVRQLLEWFSRRDVAVVTAAVRD